MAERRMLTRKITDNDNFVSLSAAAQALYLHLIMNADDDGFCSQIQTAMFRAHAKKKDLESLVAARYLIRFPNGVIVIKHWRMANAGRSDRYTPTVYQEEYAMLTVKPNKAYTMATKSVPDGNHTATERQPSDNQPLPQKRIEEKRREENTKDSVCKTRAPARTRAREETPQAPEPDPDRWEEFWNAYPRKSGGDIREACMEYMGAVESGVDPETLITAAKALAHRTAPETFRYLPSAEKWLRNKGWLENPAASQDARTNNVFLQMYEEEYGGSQ